MVRDRIIKSLKEAENPLALWASWARPWRGTAQDRIRMDTKPITHNPDLQAVPDNDLGEALSVVLELRELVLKHVPDDQRFVEVQHMNEILKKHKVDPDKFYKHD